MRSMSLHASETELREQLLVYKLMFNCIQKPLIRWGISGLIEDWNPAAESLFGWTLEEAVAHQQAHFIIPEDQVPAAEDMFDRLFGMKLAGEQTLRNITRDGRRVVCLWRNFTVVNEAGFTVGYCSSIEDVTEQEVRRWESEIRAERFQNAFERAATGVVLARMDGVFIQANASFAEMLGYTEEEVHTLSVYDVTMVEDLDRDEPQRVALIDGSQERFTTERRLFHRDGHVLDVLLSIALVRDPSGTPLHYVEQTVDITRFKDSEREMLQAQMVAERSRMEAEAMNAELQRAMIFAQELATEAEYLALSKTAVYEAISSILIAVDDSMAVTEWNPAAASELGIGPDDALQRHLGSLEIKWDWERVRAAIEECQDTHCCTRIEDIRFTRPDGRPGVLGIGLSPLGVRGVDSSWGVLLLGSDVTERRALEGQLHEAQKLEAIGQLAAGIAHEINTPTQYVSDNVRFLRRSFTGISSSLEVLKLLIEKLEEGELDAALVAELKESLQSAKIDFVLSEVPVALEEATEGLERVAGIVRAMKDFSHPGTGHMISMDLNRAILGTLTVSRHEYRYVAEVVTDLDPDMPAVSCFAAELNQVFLNIVVNAAHAIAQKVGDTGEMGTIAIQTREREGWAEIRISDTGTGIPIAAQEKVFEPFFTTKEVGKGTGQGLALAHSVITVRHGGTIAFETEIGVGTTFIVRIPLCGADAVAA